MPRLLRPNSILKPSSTQCHLVLLAFSFGIPTAEGELLALRALSMVSICQHEKLSFVSSTFTPLRIRSSCSIQDSVIKTRSRALGRSCNFSPPSQSITIVCFDILASRLVECTFFLVRGRTLFVLCVYWHVRDYSGVVVSAFPRAAAVL